MGSQSYRWFDVAGALDQVGEGPALTEMLELVASSIRRDLPVVRALLEDGNAEKAYSIMHPMKGFMPIFCISTLAEKVAELEFLCKRSDLGGAKTVLEVLSPQLLDFVVEVESYLAAQGA